MMETMSEQPEKLWREGVNQAADAIIIRSGSSVCLIRRYDGGGWALPGGFVDDNETTLEAARREAFEETGLTVEDTNGCVYSGRVDDPRNSKTRWIESDAYVFNVDGGEPKAADDADKAAWVPLVMIPRLNTLYGSHKEMIMRVIDKIEQEHLSQVRSTTELVSTKGGHMAYDYELRASNGNYIFLKAHNPANFTNPEKERHSRDYLHREAAMLRHLKRHEYPHIPARHQLLARHTLALEGLPEDAGWHWHLPEDLASSEHYVHSILASLRWLEGVPPPPDDALVKPSIVSFHEEGWGSLDDLTQVVERINSLADRLQPDTAQVAERLVGALPILKASHETVEPDPEVFSHHDARQSNIAWHPDRGVRLVDWSWAGPGVQRGDTTMFLIDLAKSGYDVRPYLKDHFSSDFAKLLIGFWLGHSVWPTRTADDTVRLHQVASAVSAYELLDF